MNNYRFDFDVRYFNDDKNFYFRKGVWNTVDGIVPYTNLDNTQLFNEYLLALKNEDKNEQANIFQKFTDRETKVVEDLVKNGFIIDAEKDFTKIAQILIGQNFNIEKIL